MEVVLLENIKNLGSIGDVVNVKRGHGRNFLIKFGKALKASKENIEVVNKKKAKLNEKNISLKKDAKKIYEILNKKKYKFAKRAKENGELYGSIKPKEISKKITDDDNVEIKPSQIDIGKEINKINEYEVKINLHPEIQAIIHIGVVKQEEEN
jgi:large subunit ribosomal protein L9